MTRLPIQNRRRSLGALAALSMAGAASGLSSPVRAQAFPARPIKLVVPHAPGGNSDAFGRALAQAMTDRIGQSVVVENRTGAGGTIACTTVARSPADGYTLVISDTGTHAIAPQLYGNRLQYDVFKDFTPITLAATFPTVILVHPSVSARNVQEFVALAKSQPGKITYSSAGTGNGSHLALDTFRHEAGRLDMIHVPYKGGAPAIQALIAGEVQMTAVSVNTSLPHIRSGKARALALASSKRSPALPELATLNEQGVPNAEADNWLGIHGPAGMPPDVVAWLNREIAAALQQPAVRERLAGQGLEVVASGADQFVEVLRKDLVRWTEAVKRSGATAG
ncbi:MAG: Bug family tripartite tricarboxylate transporter substrate binding protein [Burkholderiaceae bacterium]